MTTKIVIFDFDGTIADTLDTIVRITNRLAVDYGYKPVSLEELATLRNLSSQEIIKQSGISIFKVPFLIRKVRIALKSEIQNLKAFSGLREALIELKKGNHRLGIITSNSKENVVTFLKINDLSEVFDFIYSAPTIFGKHRVINRFLKEENIYPETVIYVGDETRDIEAARRSHIKVISVSWGFNSKEVLVKQNPDFLIDKPDELISVIRNLENPTNT